MRPPRSCYCIVLTLQSDHVRVADGNFPSERDALAWARMSYRQVRVRLYPSRKDHESGNKPTKEITL